MREDRDKSNKCCKKVRVRNILPETEVEDQSWKLRKYLIFPR